MILNIVAFYALNSWILGETLKHIYSPDIMERN